MSDIQEILESIRPDPRFSSSVDFVADALLDSLDIIRLVSELDEFFGISIEGREIVPENFLNINTIQALVNFHLDNPVE